MTLDVARLATTEPPVPAAYQRLNLAGEPFLRALLLGQSVAYGGAADASALDWLPTLRSGALLAAASHAFCWLSAGEGAQRLCAKLGFVAVGTRLN